MKKVTATLFLLALLSISIFAEGDLPGGGKYCGGQGQPTCFVQPGTDEKISVKDETVLDETLILVKSWLAEIFG